MLFVDRGVCGLLALERQAEDRLARRPDDAGQAEQPRRLEDVVSAEHVRPERCFLGADLGRGNRRQVNNGVASGQALDGLAVVGQVGEERRR